MRLSMCVVLLVICVHGMGQKLNVISVSKAYNTTHLNYFHGENPLYSDTTHLALVVHQEKLLLLNPKELPPELDNWLYQLDPDLLSHIDSNATKLAPVIEHAPATLFLGEEKKVKIRSNVQLGIPKRGLAKSLDSLRSISMVETNEEHKNLNVHVAPIYSGPAGVTEHSITYGGSKPTAPNCTIRARYDEKITTGSYEIMVDYPLHGSPFPSSYSHKFSDLEKRISGLSEYQMDVNSKGHLVYLRHIYTTGGSYEASYLVHCSPDGKIAYNKLFGFKADKNSFLVEFKNDTLLTIMGIEKYDRLVLCQGTYNVLTQEANYERKVLSSAQLVGVDQTKGISLSGHVVNNIMGYRTDATGTYVFLSKNDEKQVPYPYYNFQSTLEKMRTENKKLTHLNQKTNSSRIGSIAQAFYIIKLNTDNEVAWVNGLNFSSMCINNIADGNNFPILFNTQDKKWTKNLKGLHKRISQGVGLPMMAMVTPKGIKYVEPSFDLLKNECLILTKTYQLDDGEYVGFGAKVQSLKYDTAVDGFYEIGITWHAVRFEVSE